MPAMQNDEKSLTGSCLGCGRPRSRWSVPSGFQGAYCCQECAEGRACECPPDSDAEAQPVANRNADEQTEEEEVRE